MIKVVASDGQIWEVVQKPTETRWIPKPTQGTGAGLLGLAVGGAICGLGGYALGKRHGYNNGYDHATAEYTQLIAQFQTQIQNMRRDSAHLQAENNRLLQENGSLRKENDILKGLLRQQPTTPQAEAILKTIERVEFRLIQTLPPLFEDGGDHNAETN